MGRIDLAEIGKVRQFLVEAVEELRSQLLGDSREKIWPPHIADEECVSGENSGWVLSSRMIHDDITEVLGRVSRSLKDLDLHILDLKAVSL